MARMMDTRNQISSHYRKDNAMRLIDLKTLSAEVSISVYTLRKFRREGMPHYNIGRKILVDPDEFEEWLAERFKVDGVVSNRAVDHVVTDVLSDFGF